MEDLITSSRCDNKGRSSCLVDEINASTTILREIFDAKHLAGNVGGKDLAAEHLVGNFGGKYLTESI